MRQASVLVPSQYLTVLLCHITTVLSQYFVMLAQHCRIIYCICIRLCWCSCAVNRGMGSKL